MAGQRADGDVVAGVADVRQVGESADVDEHARLGEAQLHHRQQAVPAGEELGLVAVLADEADGLLGRSGADVVECCGDHWGPPLGLLLVDWAAWMAVHTVCGLAGIGTSWTPRPDNASTMAFMTAGAAPIVPASPTPFTPSGFVGDGVTVWPR